MILKGHHTIVTGQDGEQYINITGNSGLATGGSGDVLPERLRHLIKRYKQKPLRQLWRCTYRFWRVRAKDEYGIESVTASKSYGVYSVCFKTILQIRKLNGYML